jgi:thiamine kinase-like enzyme
MVDIERAGDNIIRDEVKPITKILKDRWYNHNDEHWWNFMRTKDRTIYMIDFGRSKITKK